MTVAGRPATGAVVVSAMTSAAMALPLGVMFGSEPLRSISRLRAAVAIPLGIALMLVIVGTTALLWGALLATVAGADRGPAARAAGRATLVLAVPVGIGVDLSQLLIDVVRTWHRLGVHVVFGVAFAVGLAVFLRGVARRVLPTLGGADDAVVARAVRSVGTWTAAGVAVGAVLALPLGWAVVPGMGIAMLDPLVLVVATGGLGGGAALGRAVARGRVAAAPGQRVRS